MRTFLALLLGVAFVSTSGLAEAFDRTVGIDAQKSLGLTVYNGGTAMVRDVRSIKLDKGENRLAFEEVSGQIQPETASLKPLDKAKFTLVEQNFDFDLLTPSKLTEKAVGSTVQVIRTNPATGAETSEDATVLSATGGVVLKYKNRIEVLGSNGFNGRLVFTKIPENLRSEPTLSVTLDAAKSSSSDVELAYLTGGLTWSADYVANLNPDETRMDLQAWVTLTNSSGTTYRNATLQLVAGKVHRVAPPRPVVAEATRQVSGVKMGAVPYREELAEYQLYTVTRPTTIANQQTKQVALFEMDGVKVTGHLEAMDIDADYAGGRGGGYAPSDSEGNKLQVSKYLTIDNTKAAGLGIPMPEGTVRVYKSDSKGRSQFIGEDSIDHTPKNEKADVLLGDSFDVTARSKRTSARTFERHSDRLGDVTVYEATYQVTAKNAKAKPETLRYANFFSANWTITDESQPHTKLDWGTAGWTLKLPAEGESKLTYTVQIEVPRSQK